MTLKDPESGDFTDVVVAGECLHLCPLTIYNRAPKTDTWTMFVPPTLNDSTGYGVTQRMLLASFVVAEMILKGPESEDFTDLVIAGE